MNPEVGLEQWDPKCSINIPKQTLQGEYRILNNLTFSYLIASKQIKAIIWSFEIRMSQQGLYKDKSRWVNKRKKD